MLGALVSEWTGLGNRQGQDLLLTTGEFNREIARERMRATRRSIPFCVLTLELVGSIQKRRRKRLLVRLLHRNVRMTDQKGVLSANKFGILLVDTPEMGGRAVLDRLTAETQRLNLNVKLDLKVHDPEGFDSDDFPSGKKQRLGDDPSQRWLRVDEANVQVSGEDPMVPRPMMRMAVKRSLDIFGASVGLTLGSPIILGSMAMVKFTSPGPALFTQTREGLRGRPFKIYKMRSMVVDAEARKAELSDANHRDGPAFKVDKDPRVTKVGRFLRASCIDELPQLWNVLKGDMSLVGPRPLPWHESRACNNWHRRRLDAKPGMTCNWQVNKAKAKTFDEWMRMDLQYIDRIGLIRDLRLIALTFLVPLTGRGSE
ncbi:sugar transferase [Stieleria marina]|uniref:Undecaprenyl-phosphate N-acetylgalactosaminyl 1-phosphate transferase n=1 Tax=Stieleria marina TaxID=1930275 RepID=A0A517NQI9_9BACT|nr:Putative undecaprenyl-phosphate N-acetylgalactosaminyl 1-phosphate transferase [Planctomycetes bacterium K23_9]